MKVLIACAFGVVIFSGPCRAQTMTPSEFNSRLRQGIYEAEFERVEKLKQTPEGRATLQAEAKAAKARADAKDPVVQARLRAYRKNHRSAIAAKKAAASPSSPAKKQAAASPPKPVPGALPGVSSFLGTHPEFGKPASTEAMPDWASGPRQRVKFEGGRNLLFYLQGGKVVTVYEDVAGKGRQKVWGEFASAN